MESWRKEEVTSPNLDIYVTGVGAWLGRLNLGCTLQGNRTMQWITQHNNSLYCVAEKVEPDTIFFDR